ncbi:archaeosortase/exosortase family protein [Sphingomonas sp. S2-65]|uniref:archaeosortase/exosortase family protein n=1 Tax=Sphingomonas sp. S2-65 TaxID=2903960 RepID=UPI001F249E69|nr:archaeosortase/exosortase family protein [Sphingomonas sp. S2-65]UYY57045.1 archaeosortase/exosortase family protein [Sphingomonas sp. S2-65]
MQALGRSGRQIVPVSTFRFGSWWSRGFLFVAAALLAAPPLVALATRYWTTAQGAQGPIILMTGAWALAYELRCRPRLLAPGDLLPTVAWLSASLGLYVLARMIGLLALECVATWSALVASLYGCAGWRLVRGGAFPLLYLLCLVPLPYTLEVAVTGALKLATAGWAVRLLGAEGWDVASSGGMLYIDQFELVMEAACSGLNSIFSLTAIGLFYVYWQRRRTLVEAIVLTAAIVPIAIVSNVARLVIVLILVHYRGQQVLATILHPAAGLLMFAISLTLLVVLDAALPKAKAGRQ